MRAKLKPSILTAVVCVVTATLACSGCSTPEDRAFRDEVRHVLKLTSELEPKLTDTAGHTGETPSDMAVASFRAAVKQLPTPRDKRLRYLSMRLAQLGTQAEVLAGWHHTLAYSEQVSFDSERLKQPGADTLSSGIWRSIESCQQKYWEAQSVVAAAERVCLGTSMLVDEARASRLGGPHDSPAAGDRYADSTLVATEKFVRDELARLR